MTSNEHSRSSKTRYASLALAAILIGLFAVPLLITPVAAFSGSSITPPPTHEISLSCKSTVLNCGTVVCGLHNGGKLPAAIVADVGYTRNGILGGQVVVQNLAVVPPGAPNPFLLGSVLSLTKSGNSFTLRGIIENTPLVTACGQNSPPLPATYTLSGTCGFNTKAYFKVNDGIRGNFLVNVACA